MRWPHRRPKRVPRPHRYVHEHEDVTVILPPATRSLNMSCRTTAKEKR